MLSLAVAVMTSDTALIVILSSSLRCFALASVVLSAWSMIDAVDQGDGKVMIRPPSAGARALPVRVRSSNFPRKT